MSRLQKLKSITTLSELALLLGYKPSALFYIIYSLSEEDKYYSFQIPKKNGDFREIKAPTERLKKLQRRLADLLNKCIDEIDKNHSHKVLSHGFRKKHSIVTNARNHNNRRYVFNVDLKDFFPSINFGRVRGYFIKNRHFELEPKIATIIAQIACLNNELPQGSPCSPVISNLIGEILDFRMLKIAKKEKCTYSRYADDLTFSTNKRDFPLGIAKQNENQQWEVASFLKGQILKSGFSLNDKKTSMQYKTARQVTTGLIVNKKINIKKEYYKKTRSMCNELFNTGKYYLSNDGEEKIIWHNKAT